MGCKSEAASHYAGCECSEAHWQDQFARLTRERDEAREELAGFLDEPRKDCLAYDAQIGLLESQIREAYAALDHFQDLASVAFRECIGREMEIGAAKALYSFWREVGVDE